MLDTDGFLEYVHKKTLGAEGFMQKLQRAYPEWTIDVVKKQSGYYIIIIAQSPLEESDPRLLDINP